MRKLEEFSVRKVIEELLEEQKVCMKTEVGIEDISVEDFAISYLVAYENFSPDENYSVKEKKFNTVEEANRFIEVIEECNKKFKDNDIEVYVEPILLVNVKYSGENKKFYFEEYAYDSLEDMKEYIANELHWYYAANVS